MIVPRLAAVTGRSVLLAGVVLNPYLSRYSEYGGGLGVTINAAAILNTWNATTLTWNNHPTAFLWAGSGQTASSQLSWVNIDVSDAASEWWQQGVALNGLALLYANESQQCQFFFSDNESSNRPTLTINYVQDTTAPTGSLLFNGGVDSTNNLNVTVQPSALDPGSVAEWSSNWTSVNGISTASPPNSSTIAHQTVDSTNSELVIDTSSCGSSACWAETYFGHTMNINNWPTFTVMFKVDNLSAFQLGLVSADNSSQKPRSQDAGLVSQLHRSSAYFRRRAALASTLDTSGRFDNSPVLTQSCRMSNVRITIFLAPTRSACRVGQVAYDPAGQVIERDILDTNNAVLLKLTYGFDSAGRSTTTTMPPALPGVQGQAGTSTVSTTTYDALGQAIEAKTTNAGLPSPSIVNDATVSYDHLGRVLGKTEEANTSSAQTTSFVYDLDGRQTSVTDPSGKVTSSTYDALGAVLTTTHPDSTVDTMTYDAAGELLSTANSAGTTKDTYDPLGRITYEERDDGTGTLQTGITYTYDANGNKTVQQTAFPGGTDTIYSWTYDKLNRAATMSDGTRTYTYDLNSNVTQMKVAVSGNTIGEDDYTYDGANRLTGLTAKVTTGSTTLHTYGYTYDAVGNRNQITTDGTAVTYSYDDLMQLTNVQQGGSTIVSYNYDANSNRTSMTTSAGTTGYTYDSSDTMLVSKQDPNGKVTNYTYDTNGNLVKAVFDPSGANQVTGYVYDKQNRLTEVDQPNGNKVQFTYDADGNRISKTVTASGTSTTIKDVYVLGHLSEQTDGSGNPLATFTYEASGRPASVVLGDPATGQRYYYVYNGHGDVVALTDSSGNVVASYSYDAFGVITSSSENFPNGWSNPYRYDGADLVRYDSETGLYWMSVRAYDPTLGRFISHDPLGRLAAEGIDFAPYVYADNNPVVKTDPSGERPICGFDCGSPGCPSGQQWNGQECVTPTKTPPPVTPPPTQTPPPINHCDPGTHSDGKGGCAPDQQTGQCGNDIRCHGDKSKNALDNYYNSKMSDGSVLMDAFNVLLDLLGAVSFTKLWDGGVVNALISFITGIADAAHLVADLMIKFNGNHVSSDAASILGFADLMHGFVAGINAFWAGLGWLGAVDGVIDSFLTAESGPMVMAVTAITLLVQAVAAGFQWFYLDQPRIAESQVDNGMTPAQQYAACQAQFGAGSANC